MLRTFTVFLWQLLLGFLRMPGEAEPGLSEVNLPMALQVIPVPATALSEDPE